MARFKSVKINTFLIITKEFAHIFVFHLKQRKMRCKPEQNRQYWVKEGKFDISYIACLLSFPSDHLSWQFSTSSLLRQLNALLALSQPSKRQQVKKTIFQVIHMGPEDPSNRKKIPIIFIKAKFSEIARRFQKCKS